MSNIPEVAGAAILGGAVDIVSAYVLSVAVEVVGAAVLCVTVEAVVAVESWEQNNIKQSIFKF